MLISTFTNALHSKELSINIIYRIWSKINNG